MGAQPAGQLVGRYAVFAQIAAGGMATVHLGRLMGHSGFSRVVALKRLHAQFANDPTFVDAFLDEARLAARIRHPNVVSTLDVVAADGELLLVMDYVQGATLARLIRAARSNDESVPLPIVSAIISGVLRGLHAVHEATGENGEPLGIVHRDISPQNVLVGADGVARVLDFGIAKAVGRSQNTSKPTLKGKIAYMPPEQASCGEITRRTDVYAVGIVLWETLTRQRLFDAEDQVALLNTVLLPCAPKPSELVSGLPPELDAIVGRALQRDPDERFATAAEMAAALEQAVPIAPPSAVATWLEELVGSTLARRAQVLAEVERAPVAMLETRVATPQPSSLTVPAERSTTSRRTLAVVALVAALAGIGLLASRGGAPPEPAASAAPLAPPARSTEPSVKAPEPTVSTKASVNPPLAAEPVASANPSSPTPQKPAPKAKCNPPYTIDALGRHRYLPECL